MGHSSAGVELGFEFPHPEKKTKKVVTVFHLLIDCICRSQKKVGGDDDIDLKIVNEVGFIRTVSAVSAVSSPSVYSLPGVNPSKSDRALSTASSS